MLINVGDYVIVRTYSAGCHAGILAEREGREVTLSGARRLWHWSGAMSLSELAQHGPRRPERCKFAAPVSIILTEAIEIIDATNGRTAIEQVPEWTA